MKKVKRKNNFINQLSLLIFLGANVLFLVACNSSGGSTPSPLASPAPSPVPTPAPTVTLECPSNYILVPGDSALSTTDFCVATYEMRDQSGSPVSQASGQPWSNVSRNSALAACQSLGSHYDLISNSQWQTLARNIASVAANWSSGTVGTGYMNIGNADNNIATVCDSTQAYVDTSCSPISPAGNFISKRTHTLSNSQIIWDLGGNLYEVVKDLSTSGQYGAGGCAADLTAVNPGSDALGTAKDAFGLASSTGFSLDTSLNGCAGLGGFNGSTSNNSSSNRAVLRGGSFYDQSGIFNVDIGWALPGDTDGSYSFRCVYK